MEEDKMEKAEKEERRGQFKKKSKEETKRYRESSQAGPSKKSKLSYYLLGEQPNG